MSREDVLNEIAVVQGFLSKFRLEQYGRKMISEIKDQLDYLIEKLNELEEHHVR